MGNMTGKKQQPYCPKAGSGRNPYPLETMLRIHLLQNWFSLSDPAMEEALYKITPMRVRAPDPKRADSGRHHDPNVERFSIRRAVAASCSEFS